MAKILSNSTIIRDDHFRFLHSDSKRLFIILNLYCHLVEKENCNKHFEWNYIIIIISTIYIQLHNVILKIPTSVCNK